MTSLIISKILYVLCLYIAELIWTFMCYNFISRSKKEGHIWCVKKRKGFLHILRIKCKTPEDVDACASTMTEVLPKREGMEFPEAATYMMEAGDYEIKDVMDRPDYLGSLSYSIF